MINQKRHIKGITLIEILVTLVIMSIGLIGLAGLQMYSLQTNNSALMRSQATYLVMDMFDRMRLNREAALNGDYDYNAGTEIDLNASGWGGLATDVLSGPPATAGSTIASADIFDWTTLVSQSLPNGKGSIDCTNPGNNVCRVVVRWEDTRGNYIGNHCALNDPACFIAETRLFYD